MSALDRSRIPELRNSFKILGLVVAEVDTDLRYVWIDNPHPDFDPATVIGKRDDQLIDPEEAGEIMDLKRAALQRGKPVSRVLGFQRTDGLRLYSIFAWPLRNGSGQPDGVLTVGFDTPGILDRILPICSYCKKIRDEADAWQDPDVYVRMHTDARFSHSICPECFPKHCGDALDAR